MIYRDLNSEGPLKEGSKGEGGKRGRHTLPPKYSGFGTLRGQPGVTHLRGPYTKDPTIGRLSENSRIDSRACDLGFRSRGLATRKLRIS